MHSCGHPCSPGHLTRWQAAGPAAPALLLQGDSCPGATCGFCRGAQLKPWTGHPGHPGPRGRWSPDHLAEAARRSGPFPAGLRVAVGTVAFFPRGQRTEDSVGCPCQAQDSLSGRGNSRRPEGPEQMMTPEVWEGTWGTYYAPSVCQGPLATGVSWWLVSLLSSAWEAVAGRVDRASVQGSRACGEVAVLTRGGPSCSGSRKCSQSSGRENLKSCQGVWVVPRRLVRLELGRRVAEELLPMDVGPASPESPRRGREEGSGQSPAPPSCGRVLHAEWTGGGRCPRRLCRAGGFQVIYYS